MSKLPCCEKGWVDSFRSEEARQIAKYDRLKELDLFVLDNSIRETSIGQLKGHTAEDKFRIYEEAAKCGFKVCSNDGLHDHGHDHDLNRFVNPANPLNNKKSLHHSFYQSIS